MSTKIYKGRRLQAGTDVFAFSNKLRETLMPIRERLDAEMIIADAVSLHDEAVAGSTLKKGRSPVSAAVNEYFTAQREADPRHRDHDPHRFEAGFGFDSYTGHILMLPHCEQDAFMTALDAMPEVEDYAYWDNTDPDPTVSEDDWEEREEVWDRVLPLGIPAQTMLELKLSYSPTASVMTVFSAIRKELHPAVLTAIKNVDSTDDRAKSLVRRRIGSLGIHALDNNDIFAYLNTVGEHASRVAPQIVDQLPAITLDRLYLDEITPTIDTDELDKLITAAL